MENDFYNFFWQIFNVLFETNKQKFSSYKLKRITSNKKNSKETGMGEREKSVEKSFNFMYNFLQKVYRQ